MTIKFNPLANTNSSKGRSTTSENWDTVRNLCRVVWWMLGSTWALLPIVGVSGPNNNWASCWKLNENLQVLLLVLPFFFLFAQAKKVRREIHACIPHLLPHCWEFPKLGFPSYQTHFCWNWGNNRTRARWTRTKEMITDCPNSWKTQSNPATGRRSSCMEQRKMCKARLEATCYFSASNSSRLVSSSSNHEMKNGHKSKEYFNGQKRCHMSSRTCQLFSSFSCFTQTSVSFPHKQRVY